RGAGTLTAGTLRPARSCLQRERHDRAQEALRGRGVGRVDLLTAAHGVDLVELAVEAASTGALELLERVPCRLEAAPHLVHLVDELVPLLLESPEQRQDLVRRLREPEVVDRLADD